MSDTPKYWTGLEELHQTPEFIKNRNDEFPGNESVDEFLGNSGINDIKTGRRDFLKFLGFSVAAATLAACESPAIKSIPYVIKPEDVTPGVANWYATTFYDGNDYASVLVKTREARPIHIKANKDFGFTKGGINPRITASVLPLYDSERLQAPYINGAKSTWDAFDGEIAGKLDMIAGKGGNIVLLTSTIISPSLLMAIEAFRLRYGADPIMTAAPSNTETVASDSTAVAPAPVPVTADTVASDSTATAAATAEPAAPGKARVQHVQYDAVSYSAIRKANKKTFGMNFIPVYDFSKAEVIVSVSADFLANWLNSTSYAAQYAAGRNPDGGKMSKHFQFETIMSLSGANADIRRRIKPSQQGLVVAALFDAVGGNSGVDTSSLDAHILDAIAEAGAQLKASKGKGIVVAGDNDENIQILVNAINQTLGNYSKDGAIDHTRTLNMFAADDTEVEKIMKAAAGEGDKIDALIICGVNPVYSLPGGQAFGDALAGIELTVCVSQYMDETATKCKYVGAENHYLESWGDMNPASGHYAMAQPLIRPLYDTASFLECVLVWGGNGKRAGKSEKGVTEHQYIRSIWEKFGYPTRKDEYAVFEDYWNWSVHNGSSTIEERITTSEFNTSAVSAASTALKKAKTTGNWEVVVYQKPGMGAGNHANNPWLQEMPDPITKVTWDNYIAMAPRDMEKLGFRTYIGQQDPASVAIVKAGGVDLQLPVIAQPGQAEGTLAIALGYGRGENNEKIGKSCYQTGEYGDYLQDENGKKVPIGKNAFRVTSFKDGLIKYDVLDGDITGTEESYYVASSQTHHTVMGRDSIIRETTLSFFNNGSKETIFDEEKKAWQEGYNPTHTLPVHEDVNEDGHIDSRDRKPLAAFDLWDEHPVEKVGHRWGMTVDLSTCIGCGSCLIACQSENNVPVVGKDEILRVRDMFWLRLDRYYSSDQESLIGKRNEEWSYKAMERPEDNPKVVFMPLMCQHCNHAPCETVCPVIATAHSNEGLNQMAYNRCIGTRYCANNCPYKVRRFNWFNYPDYKKFTAANPAQDHMQRMVLNPDVTVRTRGVMEKCSMCVQRIQDGKLKAKVEGRTLVDGDAVTACADACPTDALIFGDLNDMVDERGTAGSRVHHSAKSARSYHLLEEIGTRPNIFYKVKVRNIEIAEKPAEKHDHA
jgi:molybdopterin-containing oxidoreductase family iron-sulfur binding subunit